MWNQRHLQSAANETYKQGEKIIEKDRNRIRIDIQRHLPSNQRNFSKNCFQEYSRDGVSPLFLLYFIISLTSKRWQHQFISILSLSFSYYLPSLFICVSFAALWRWRWFPNFYPISVLFQLFALLVYLTAELISLSYRYLINFIIFFE